MLPKTAITEITRDSPYDVLAKEWYQSVLSIDQLTAQSVMELGKLDKRQKIKFYKIGSSASMSYCEKMR